MGRAVSFLSQEGICGLPAKERKRLMSLILEEEHEAESDPVHIRTLQIPTRRNFQAGPRRSDKEERG